MFQETYFCLNKLMQCTFFVTDEKNDIRDVGSTADLVLVFLVYLVHWYMVHLVHWYMVHWYLMVPDCT